MSRAYLALVEVAEELAGTQDWWPAVPEVWALDDHRETEVGEAVWEELHATLTWFWPVRPEAPGGIPG